MAANIKTEVIDELLASCASPSDLLADNGLFKQLKKQLLERLLGTELTQHLGYREGGGRGAQLGQQPERPYGENAAERRGRRWSWRSRATAPARSQPQIVPKGSRRLDGFDDAHRQPVCARDVGARDPGPFAGDVWHSRCRRI